MKNIIDQWFVTHPQDRDGVIRAGYAYSKKQIFKMGEHRWPRFPPSDNFDGLRGDACMACGRTRWEVRHGNQHPACIQSKFENPKDVILEEEKKYMELVNNSKHIIDKVIKQRGLSGETLSTLHHSYGIDIEVAECHLELNDQLRRDYMTAWEKHKATGGKFKG